jgi:hypothetical protein
MGKQLNAESGDGTWAVLVQPLELICGGAEWERFGRESAELEDGGDWRGYGGGTGRAYLARFN